MAHIPKLAPSFEADDVLKKIDSEEIRCCIAHDGSIAARACLSFAMNYLAPKFGNTMHTDVLHCYKMEKQEELLRNYQKAVIKSELEAHDLAKGENFKLHLIDQTYGTEKPGKRIVEWTFEQEEAGKGVDFLFMGFKGTSKADEEDLLASDVSYAMAYSRCSMVVMRKDPVFSTPGKLHWCVPVDLNKWSEKALFDALLMSSEGDKISIIHIRISQDENVETQQYYEKLVGRFQSLLTKPREISFQQIRHGGTGAANDIINFVNEQQCDIISMGTNSMRLMSEKPYLSSVCTGVLLQAKCPLVVAHYDETWSGVISAESRPRIPSLPDAQPPVITQ